MVSGVFEISEVVFLGIGPDLLWLGILNLIVGLVKINYVVMPACCIILPIVKLQ